MAYRKLSERFGAEMPKPPKDVGVRVSTAAFADVVLIKTLRLLQLGLPIREREDWTGSSSKKADAGRLVLGVKVELRHKCGRLLSDSVSISYAEWDAAGVHRKSAESFATRLAGRLESMMRSHMRRQHDERYVRDAAKLPALSKMLTQQKKRKKTVSCALCGETDAKYPPWEGVCDHTLKERRGKHV